ncbi:MAG: sensor histidine kinase [Lachnospiraceae bacterium]|nr:sensor histidine kinase [Lachnospiraceae bacterium]
MAVTLSSILFMCVVIAAVSYFFFHKYMQSSLISSTESNLKMLGDSINENIQDVYRMARFCQGSSDIAEYIKASPEPGSLLSVSTYDRLYEEYQNNASSSYIPRVVIAAQGHYLQACQASYSTSVNLAEKIPELPYFTPMLSADDYDFSEGMVTDPFLRGRTGKYVIPLIRPISYRFRSNAGGYLFMEISGDMITSKLSSYYMEPGSSLYLGMGEHLYLISDTGAEEIQPQYEVTEDLSGMSVAGSSVYRLDTPEGRRTVIVYPLLMNGCFLAQTVSPQESVRQMRLFTLILVAILVGMIAIGLAMVKMMNDLIHKPLSRIREKIGHISEGDFSRDGSIEADHEIGEIGKGINDLSESVSKLLDSRVENEKQKRDLEYKMLQSQINPHFLYNTLNSIKMMSQAQGATGITEMTTSLATLLRSISKGTSLLIPISEELSLVRHYYTIQNLRYGGMIRLDVRVDDDSIMDALILKFTLQPIVENAIFHGLEPKGGMGLIDIHAYYEPRGGSRDIFIDVRDDGVGIPAGRCETLLSDREGENRSEFFKEIGISNVHKRLMYEFGEDYGLFLESAEGKYTNIRVRIPERRENV